MPDPFDVPRALLVFAELEVLAPCVDMCLPVSRIYVQGFFQVTERVSRTIQAFAIFALSAIHFGQVVQTVLLLVQ